MHAWARTLAVAAVLAATTPALADESKPTSLTAALAVLKSHRFVDLTHSFAPGIPRTSS